MEMKLKWVKDEERVGLGNVGTVYYWSGTSRFSTLSHVSRFYTSS